MTNSNQELSFINEFLHKQAAAHGNIEENMTKLRVEANVNAPLISAKLERDIYEGQSLQTILSRAQVYYNSLKSMGLSTFDEQIPNTWLINILEINNSAGRDLIAENAAKYMQEFNFTDPTEAYLQAIVVLLLENSSLIAATSWEETLQLAHCAVGNTAVNYPIEQSLTRIKGTTEYFINITLNSVNFYKQDLSIILNNDERMEKLNKHEKIYKDAALILPMIIYVNSTCRRLLSKTLTSHVKILENKLSEAQINHQVSNIVETSISEEKIEFENWLPADEIISTKLGPNSEEISTTPDNQLINDLASVEITPENLAPNSEEIPTAPDNQLIAEESIWDRTKQFLFYTTVMAVIVVVFGIASLASPSQTSTRANEEDDNDDSDDEVASLDMRL